MHSFYKLNIFIQWSIALTFAIVAGLLLNFWFYSVQQHYWFLSFVFLFIPVIQFLTSPILTLLGLYHYVSPMVLLYSLNGIRYEIHNGTTFDYLFTFSRKQKGTKWQNRLLLYYIEGLLNIIQSVENHKIPTSAVFIGASYFFSERTAQRMGFEIQKTPFSKKVEFVLNYFTLTLKYSLSKKGIHFPKFTALKTITISGESLIKNKAILEKTQLHLQQKLCC